ncbi:esterase [Roseateles sp. BYS180W]|uniref:Esterase n=1 Tax=Roseateles rivi TaxID=3299028 RepID=A0ABW7FTF8_9BURK
MTDTLHLVRPREGAPQLLFVLLHGAGADVQQMLPMAQRLHHHFPQALLLLPQGPEAFDAIPGGGAGQQWYSLHPALQGDSAAQRAAQAQSLSQALPPFVERLRHWQQQWGIEPAHTALVGFSQGATLALEAVQAEPALAGRVLAFGGSYTWWPQHAPEEVCLHLLHGLEDTEVPHGPLLQAARALLALGADLTADVLPGIGHELHPELMARALHQLQHFIPARLWRAAQQADAQAQAQADDAQDD